LKQLSVVLGPLVYGSFDSSLGLFADFFTAPFLLRSLTFLFFSTLQLAPTCRFISFPNLVEWLVMVCSTLDLFPFNCRSLYICNTHPLFVSLSFSDFVLLHSLPATSHRKPFLLTLGEPFSLPACSLGGLIIPFTQLPLRCKSRPREPSPSLYIP